MYRRTLTFSAPAVLVIIGGLSAQDREKPYELKVDVRLVNVVATVTDEKGRYVAELTPEDFIVEDDGVRQEIGHFSQDQDIPVSVGLVLDTSGSMERKIGTAVAAVDRFIRTIHEDDDIFLMTFAGRPVFRQNFTDDREKLSRALSRIHVGGGTALYDALVEGLDRIVEGRHDKQAILLITDGEDTSSDVNFDQAAQAVRESERLVYCLGISPGSYGPLTEHVPIPWPLPPVILGPRGGPRGGRQPSSRRDTVDMNVLETFADSSGGKAFLLSGTWREGRDRQIGRVLNEIADELRNQYTIGYYPSHSKDDGRFHSLQIRTTSDRYHVRARKGYFAPKK